MRKQPKAQAHRVCPQCGDTLGILFNLKLGASAVASPTAQAPQNPFPLPQVRQASNGVNGFHQTPVMVKPTETPSTLTRRTEGFECPQCGAHLWLPLQIIVGEIEISEEPLPRKRSDGYLRYRDGVAANSHLLFKYKDELDKLEAAGILKAFGEALAAHRGKGGNPKHLRSFYLTFVAVAKQPRNFAQFLLPTLEEEFGPGWIDILVGEGVCAVLHCGILKRFIPQRALKQLCTNSKPVKANQAMIGIRQEVASLEAWTKTKQGYALANARIFIQDMLFNSRHVKRPLRSEGRRPK